MPDFKVLAVNHTSFTVSDLDRSIAFFRDVLGFRVTSKAPRDPDTIEHVVGVPGADIVVAFLQAPGHAIELIEYLGPADRGKVQSRPCDTGFAHIAFDVDDVDAAVAAAADHDVHAVNPPRTIDTGPNTGARVVYLRDTDGVTVEFIQRPSTA